MTADEPARKTARTLAQFYLAGNDPLGWFEALYVDAGGRAERIPWADRMPNPNLIDWLDRAPIPAEGLNALVVGCGLGDDAEELDRRGFNVVAFDIATSAIDWCRRRFPDSNVTYTRADLFQAPASWSQRFQFVVECYTLQVLPKALRPKAMACIAEFVAPGGRLFVISRGREPHEDPGQMPWPLTMQELAIFQRLGLEQISFEDYLDRENPPVRRFRAVYRHRRTRRRSRGA